MHIKITDFGTAKILDRPDQSQQGWAMVFNILHYFCHDHLMNATRWMNYEYPDVENV